MTGITMIASQESPPALEPDQIAILQRSRWRELSNEVREITQIVVAQSFRCLIHDINHTLFFAKKIELDQCIKRRSARPVMALPAFPIVPFRRGRQDRERAVQRALGPAREAMPPQSLHKLEWQDALKR